MVCFSLSNHLHAYFRTFFASKGTAKAETVFPFYQRTASCIFHFFLPVEIPVRHPGFFAVKEQIPAPLRSHQIYGAFLCVKLYLFDKAIAFHSHLEFQRLFLKTVFKVPVGSPWLSRLHLQKIADKGLADRHGIKFKMMIVHLLQMPFRLWFPKFFFQLVRKTVLKPEQFPVFDSFQKYVNISRDPIHFQKWTWKNRRQSLPLPTGPIRYPSMCLPQTGGSPFGSETSPAFSGTDFFQKTSDF